MELIFVLWFAYTSPEPMTPPNIAHNEMPSMEDCLAALEVYKQRIAQVNKPGTYELSCMQVIRIAPSQEAQP